MKRHLLGLMGAAVGATVWVACANDPTGTIRGSLARVAPSAAFTEIIVGDSATYSVRAEDEQGNPLPVLPAVTVADPSIATVTVDNRTSGNPLPQTNFFVKATGFGTTTVTMTAGGRTAEMTVRTLPKSIDVTAVQDTVNSGGSVTLTAVALDNDGNALAGIPIEFSSGDEDVASVDPVTGEVTTKAPGDVTITAVGPESETGGRAQAEGSVTLTVVPGAFTGTLSAASADFADQITIMPGTVAWDGDEVVTIDGLDPFIESQSTTEIVIRVPNAAVGTAEVLITGQGPDQIASVADLDITSSYTPNADPGASPDITAGPFPQEFWLSLSDAAPDDFLGIYMPAADLDITITLEWQGPSDDLDILTTDCPVTVFVGNLSGASSANPEVTQETVPAGECWQLWINKFDTGTGETTARVTVTSP